MLRKKMTATLVSFLMTPCTNGFGQSIGEGVCYTEDPIQKTGYNYQAVIKDAKWLWTDGLEGSEPGNIKIGVYFQNGTPQQRETVRERAKSWVGRYGAGIEWVFSDDTNEDIRIAFEDVDGKNGGGESVIGKQAKSGDKTKPSMTFFTKDGALPSQRTILHEFGHALGLLHEHQHPGLPFRFNEANVMKDMIKVKFCDVKNTQGIMVYIGNQRCLQRVRLFITKPPNTAHACPGAPKYDERSIMHYDIPKGWILGEPNKEIIAGSTLSALDLACVRRMYPRRIRAPEGQPQRVSQAPYCYVRSGHPQIYEPVNNRLRRSGHFDPGDHFYAQASRIPDLPYFRQYCSRMTRWRWTRAWQGFVYTAPPPKTSIVCDDQPPRYCGPAR
jgi:hypothetical protein